MSSIRMRQRRHGQQHPDSFESSSDPTPTSNSTSAWSVVPDAIAHPCTTMSNLFASFGAYLSTHQVPALLSTAFVICSLLSPSVVLYLAPYHLDGSASTTKGIGVGVSALQSRGRGELVWELEGLKRQGLIATEEPVCWDRVKKYYELTGREHGGRRLRVEQLVVNVNLLRKRNLKKKTASSSQTSATTTIGKDVLHKSWALERELEQRLVDGLIAGNDCVRHPRHPNRCAVLSPARWWHDEQSLLADDDVHETLSRPPRPLLVSEYDDDHLGNDTANLVPTSLPLTLSETFVGLGYDRAGSVKTAQHLVLTFFLQDVPSRSSSSSPSSSSVTSSKSPATTLSELGGGNHNKAANSTMLEDFDRNVARLNWRKAVREVVDGAMVARDRDTTTRTLAEDKNADGDRDGIRRTTPPPPPRIALGVSSESKSNQSRHVLLKFLPHLVVDAHPRRLENIIYAFGYLLVIVYVTRYIRRLRAHSKMGLIVTGVAELSSSGVMSVSICWLMGWNLGLVPWNLMAFLVLTSGLDNMILVLRAISQTDLNLTVPERMAVGLRQVGVEMTVLLMVEELIAAWLLWFVEITVMRQWIRFGAVVLAVDYFLELTFFSTVLSIDIQRLELADLLAHNTTSSSSSSSNGPAGPSRSSIADAGGPGSSPSGGGGGGAASRGATKMMMMGGPKSIATTRKSLKGFVKASWKVLKDRPAKTSTVAFLWVINVLLWAFYGSEHYLPATCSQTALSSDRPFLAPSLDPSLSRALRLGQSDDPSAASHLSVPLGSGKLFWDLVNPHNASSVQIYLEPTMSIQLFDHAATAAAAIQQIASSSSPDDIVDGVDVDVDGDDDDDDFYRSSPAPESVQLPPSGYVSGGDDDDGEVGRWTRVLIVVLPILVVMGLLRLLLVYLLKDAELLQARWGSEERLSAREKDKDDDEYDDDEDANGGAFDSHHGPARVEVVRAIGSGQLHRGDVEIVASGGNVVVSWAGLEQEIQVRRRVASRTTTNAAAAAAAAATRTSLDRFVSPGSEVTDPSAFATRLHVPLGPEPVSIVALSVDADGKFCAAVTNRGRVFVWALERGGTLVDFGDGAHAAAGARAVSLATARGRDAHGSGSPLPRDLPVPPLATTTTTGAASRLKSLSEPAFFSLHCDGAIVRWGCQSCEATRVFEPSKFEEDGARTRPSGGGGANAVTRRHLIVPTNTFEGATSPFLAQTYDDGRVEVVKFQGEERPRTVFALESSADGGGGGATPSIAALSTHPVVSPLIGVVGELSIVTVSHVSNGVTFYTAPPAPSLAPVPIASLPALDAPIRQVRLHAAPTDTVCPSCLEPIRDGFVVSVSTRATMRVFRLFTPPPMSSSVVGAPCACNSSSSSIADAPELSRSRASSFGVGGGGGGTTPAMTRVLSGGGGARRYSPRKKPTTPTRPSAFVSNPSTAMSSSSNSSSADPFVVAHAAVTAAGNNEPATLGTPSQQDRRTSFSSQQQLSPVPPPPPKRTPSGTSLEDGSPPSTGKSSPEATPLGGEEEEPRRQHERGPSKLRVVELATVDVDERGGWDVAGNFVIGLRRRRIHEGAATTTGGGGGGRRRGDARGWQVWTVSLERLGIKPEGSNRAGGGRQGEGTTSLRRLVDESDSLDAASAAESPASWPSPTPSGSTLRRRHAPRVLSPLGSQSRTRGGGAVVVDAALPFSRVGPFAPSFSGSAVAVALGNRVMVLSPCPGPSSSSFPTTDTSSGRGGANNNIVVPAALSNHF